MQTKWPVDLASVVIPQQDLPRFNDNVVCCFVSRLELWPFFFLGSWHSIVWARQAYKASFLFGSSLFCPTSKGTCPECSFKHIAASADDEMHLAAAA